MRYILKAKQNTCQHKFQKFICQFDDPSISRLVCLDCYGHLDIQQAFSSGELKPDCVHFYLLVNAGEKMTAVCTFCSLSWNIQMLPRLIPSVLLDNLLKQSAAELWPTTLLMLCFYIVNRINNGKEINITNPKFLAHIQWNSTSQQLFKLFGYTLQGNSLFPLPVDDHAPLYYMLQELALYRRDLSMDIHSTKFCDFQCSDNHLLSAFGASCNQVDIDPSELTFTQVLDQLDKEPSSYSGLGCSSFASDNQIKSCFKYLIIANPTQKLEYLSHLKILGEIRDSNELRSFYRKEQLMHNRDHQEEEKLYLSSEIVQGQVPIGLKNIGNT